MSSQKFPPCPPQLKAVQHYLKLASDYDNRELVISYWARLYALQSALKIDRKSVEAKALLTSLMDWLETFKKEHHENEGITSDVAGQAVLENEAHKLFSKADSDDRSAVFNKNVVKTFYTAGVLFDIIEVFGELTDEIASQRKYAKWKATYIHKCLKSGETPIPGPSGQEEGFDYGFEGHSENVNNPGINFPSVPQNYEPTSFNNQDFNVAPQNTFGNQDFNVTPQNTFSNQDFNVAPQNTTNPIDYNIPPPESEYTTPSASSTGVNLTPACYAKAQKYCKYAVSSMDYEDSATAISYLTKALNILTLGKEN